MLRIKNVCIKNVTVPLQQIAHYMHFLHCWRGQGSQCVPAIHNLNFKSGFWKNQDSCNKEKTNGTTNKTRAANDWCQIGGIKVKTYNMSRIRMPLFLGLFSAIQCSVWWSKSCNKKDLLLSCTVVSRLQSAQLQYAALDCARDIERSPLFSMLQTPSKTFRNSHYHGWCEGCCGKHVKNFKSSYVEKLFLHICKLEWFKSIQTCMWVDGNVFICSQGP